MSLRWTLCLLCMLPALGCDAEVDPPAMGTLERERLELIAEARERIVEIAVEEGQKVEPGDLLVRLDESLYRTRAERAEGTLGAARAALAELLRGTRVELVAEAEARLAEARSSLVQARLDHERALRLTREKVEPPATLDRAVARLGAAEAQVAAAEANLARLIEGATAEEIDRARAAVVEAESALASEIVALERLSVFAPVAGTVDALPYEIGERPPPGATVVVLLSSRRTFARVYVPEPIRSQVRPGSRVTVRVDSREDVEGRVRWVASEASFTPYYALTEHDRGRLVYLAEIDLVGSGAASLDLPSGVPVEVHFDLGSEHDE